MLADFVSTVSWNRSIVSALEFFSILVWIWIFVSILDCASSATCGDAIGDGLGEKYAVIFVALYSFLPLLRSVVEGEYVFLTISIGAPDRLGVRVEWK